MAVEFNVVQDHLGFSSEGLMAVGTQVLLQHRPVSNTHQLVKQVTLILNLLKVIPRKEVNVLS